MKVGLIADSWISSAIATLCSHQRKEEVLSVFCLFDRRGDSPRGLAKPSAEARASSFNLSSEPLGPERGSSLWLDIEGFLSIAFARRDAADVGDEGAAKYRQR